MINKKILFFFALLILLTNNLFAQFNDYNPSYDWYTISGKHVKVHFHEGAERSAKTVLKIAEEVWGPITSLYGYEPGTVHFVIKDIDDYSNGATYFFDNKIEIWASALDFDLRGAHNWLRNVISHEFTHMVQIQSAMKLGRGIPAVYLQVMNYEDEYRPDILYGYPNVIVSYPVATLNMPAWFAEGTAQYMRPEFNYDNWDTHRDMILRSYALDGDFLTWNQMGVFGKTSLGNESVYNSGFALTRYISQKYGEDKLMKITRDLGHLTTFTIDGAFKDVLGKDGDEIYNEWTSFLKKNYQARTKDVLQNVVTGKMIGKVGFGNFYPTFSEDGKSVFYISNKSADYFSVSGIYKLNIATGKEENLISGTRSTIAVIPKQNKIVYAMLSDDNPKWANIHDLYVYDINKDENTRLTYGLRANNPGVSPDGEKIVFLYQKDGTSNIGTVDINGKNFKRLTFYEHGEQVYNPKFSPDGKYIIYDYSFKETRDIASVDTSGANQKFILKTSDDERNPVFDKDGNIIFASDRTGIFNIYKMNVKNGKTTQLTNVVGGAFMPAVDSNGNIAYAGYTSKGYKLFYISAEQQKQVDPTKHYKKLSNPPLGKWKPKGDLAKFNINALRNYDDTKIPDYKVKKYSGFFSKLTFYPFIRYDNINPHNNGLDKIKPGLYVTSSDVLNRYSFFAGAAINRKLERDLFFIFDYRDRLPLLYNLGLKPNLSLEVYSVSRQNNTNIGFGADSTFSPPRYDFEIPVDITYNLFEVDLSAKHRFFSRHSNIEFRFSYSSYQAEIGSFTIPSKNLLFQTFKDNYFIGRNFGIKYSYENIAPTKLRSINPIGMKLEFKYNYEFDKYNDTNSYTIQDGILKPVFTPYNFHRLELNVVRHFETFKDQTISVKLRGGTILGKTIPDFFDFYLGGLIGMRGYPFYAISGNEIGWLNITYRFPLFQNIDTRVGQLYVDNIFLSVYGDLGNAWNGDFPALSSFKKGIGAEIRIKMNSFYLFPTALFFDAAYSFDTFTRIVRGQSISYGKQWRLYGGVLFDFNL